LSRTFRSLIAASALSLATAGAALAAPDGASLFQENCSACHQPTGQGIPGAFPALAGNPFVVGPADPVAVTVLNGRGGMPTFKEDLTDEQIATVLTYVRSAWGNKAPPIEVATVAAKRTGGSVSENVKSVLPYH
jgi:mono/diheme cytochrome c family protein